MSWSAVKRISHHIAFIHRNDKGQPTPGADDPWQDPSVQLNSESAVIVGQWRSTGTPEYNPFANPASLEHTATSQMYTAGVQPEAPNQAYSPQQIYNQIGQIVETHNAEVARRSLKVQGNDNPTDAQVNAEIARLGESQQKIDVDIDGDGKVDGQARVIPNHRGDGSLGNIGADRDLSPGWEAQEDGWDLVYTDEVIFVPEDMREQAQQTQSIIDDAADGQIDNPKNLNPDGTLRTPTFGDGSEQVDGAPQPIAADYKEDTGKIRDEWNPDQQKSWDGFLTANQSFTTAFNGMDAPTQQAVMKRYAADAVDDDKRQETESLFSSTGFTAQKSAGNNRLSNEEIRLVVKVAVPWTERLINTVPWTERLINDDGVMGMDADRRIQMLNKLKDGGDENFYEMIDKIMTVGTTENENYDGLSDDKHRTFALHVLTAYSNREREGYGYIKDEHKVDVLQEVWNKVITTDEFQSGGTSFDTYDDRNIEITAEGGYRLANSDHIDQGDKTSQKDMVEAYVSELVYNETPWEDKERKWKKEGYYF